MSCSGVESSGPPLLFQKCNKNKVVLSDICDVLALHRRKHRADLHGDNASEQKKLLLTHNTHLAQVNELRSPEVFSVGSCEGDRGSLKRHQKSTEYSYVLDLIKVCGKRKDLQKGSRIHRDLVDTGLLKNDVFLATALLSMYTKCGAVAKAQEMFDELQVRDVVSWTELIDAYAQRGLGSEALHCFERMQDEGILPNMVTYTCVLKACSSVGAAAKGEEIHTKVRSQELLQNNVVLGTALVDMYARRGAFVKAQEVFVELLAPDVTLWNALITGYVQHGLFREALDCIRHMKNEGFYPNDVIFICALKACGSLGAKKKGEEIHAEVSRQGLLEKFVLLGSAVVDMYAKCGEVAKAQEVFNKLSKRDVITWTALISGYVHHGLGNEALDCFEQMQDEGLFPDAATFACILKACGSIGAVERGEGMHNEVRRQGMLWKNVVLGTALVDMYAKCGALENACEVFNELQVRDVISWAALMAGYAQVGQGKMVLDTFFKMMKEDVKPNVVTFVALLTVCSHVGLIEEGQMYYEAMSTVYHSPPTLEHHACMVDLFSRAGHLDNARRLIDKVPSSDCLSLLLDLLGACWKWLNVQLGEWTFDNVIKLEEEHAAAYMWMSNIYVASGMPEAANKIETSRGKIGVTYPCGTLSAH